MESQEYATAAELCQGLIRDSSEATFKAAISRLADA
jgi:hypothetical protein